MSIHVWLIFSVCRGVSSALFRPPNMLYLAQALLSAFSDRPLNHNRFPIEPKSVVRKEPQRRPLANLYTGYSAMVCSITQQF